MSLMFCTDVSPPIHLSSQPSGSKWIHSSTRNTWILKGLLFLLGEWRETQEAGQADLAGPLSPGLTSFPGLFGWAAAAGWKKSAGTCNAGEDSRPPLLQLPPSASAKGRLQFNRAVAAKLTLLSLCSSVCMFYHGYTQQWEPARRRLWIKSQPWICAGYLQVSVIFCCIHLPG